MIPFQDVTILAALFNFFSMIGNLFWSWRLNSVRGNNELVSYWKGECEIKDNQLKELTSQYHHLVIENKHLHGQVSTYQQFHKHSI